MQLEDLLQHNAEAPNEIIAYLVERAKDTHAQFVATESNIKNLRRQLETMEHRHLALESVQQSYVKDIEFWLQKEQDVAEQEATDGREAEPGGDQHGHEGPGAPEKVAPGKRKRVAGVQRKGSRRRTPVAGGRTGPG